MPGASEEFLARLVEAARAAERDEREFRDNYYNRLAALEQIGRAHV